jgi:peptidoglycan/LPS O-acetylase OafA/YrhL
MRPTLHNLQALRGVACLAVVVYHVAQAEAGYGLGFNPVKPARWLGYAGVDLFFVLSGFIITTTSLADLGRPRELSRYLFRRVWRIYPTYWAAVAVCAALLAVADAVTFGPEPLSDLLLLPKDELPRVVPVAWTLRYEMMFYLAFALLFLLPARAAVPALAGWASTVIVVGLAGYSPPTPAGRMAVSPFVLEFMAGCLLAWCPARFGGRQTAALVLIAVAWLAVGSLIAYRPDPNWLPTAAWPRVLVFGPPAALVVLAAVGRERAGGRIRWRWLTAVGDASYSIYLTHSAAMVAVVVLTQDLGWSHHRAQHLVWIALMLAAGVLPGLVLYRLAERPLLNLVKRPKPAMPTTNETPARMAA